jgi:hypothetical protein
MTDHSYHNFELVTSIYDFLLVAVSQALLFFCGLLSMAVTEANADCPLENRGVTFFPIHIQGHSELEHRLRLLG